jgi:hypothetical protein
MAYCCAQNKSNQEHLGSVSGFHVLAECLSGNECEMTKIEVVRLAGYVGSRSACRRSMGQCREGEKIIAGLVTFLCSSNNSRESKSLALRSLCFCVTNTRQEKTIVNRKVLCKNDGLRHILTLLSGDGEESIQRDAIKTVGQCFTEYELQVTHQAELQEFCDRLVQIVENSASSQKLLLTTTAVIRQCIEVKNSLGKGILLNNNNIFSALQSVLLKASDFNIKMQTTCIFYECARSMEPSLAEQQIPVVSVLQVLLHTLQYEIQKVSNRKKENIRVENTANSSVYLDLYMDIVKEKTELQAQCNSIQTKVQILEEELARFKAAALINNVPKSIVPKSIVSACHVRSTQISDCDVISFSDENDAFKFKPREEDVNIKAASESAHNIPAKLNAVATVKMKLKDEPPGNKLNAWNTAVANTLSEQQIEGTMQVGTKPGEETTSLNIIISSTGFDERPTSMFTKLSTSAPVNFQYEKDFELKSKTPLPIPGRQQNVVEENIQPPTHQNLNRYDDFSHLKILMMEKCIAFDADVLWGSDSFIYRKGFLASFVGPIGFPVGLNLPLNIDSTSTFKEHLDTNKIQTSPRLSSITSEHTSQPFTPPKNHNAYHGHFGENKQHTSGKKSSVCLAYRHLHPRPVGIAIFSGKTTVKLESEQNFHSARHNQAASESKSRSRGGRIVSNRKTRHTRSLSPSSKVSRQAHGYFSDEAADVGEEASDEEKTVRSFSIMASEVEGSTLFLHLNPVRQSSNNCAPLVF